MQCIYCLGDTRVNNSRPTKTTNGVWRRRQCQTCGAIFTSREAADLEASVVFAREDAQLEPFSRDRLLTSIYESCKHRSDSSAVAGPLTDTIIHALLTQSKAPSVVERQALVRTAHLTLLRFDEYAARHYEAYVIRAQR